jgi:hypothetical protein
MQFWFVTTISKYLNVPTYSKDLLAIFITWFYPEVWWSAMNIYLIF